MIGLFGGCVGCVFILIAMQVGLFSDINLTCILWGICYCRYYITVRLLAVVRLDTHMDIDLKLQCFVLFFQF